MAAEVTDFCSAEMRSSPSSNFRNCGRQTADKLSANNDAFFHINAAQSAPQKDRLALSGGGIIGFLYEVGVSEVCPLEIAVERGAKAIVFVNPMVPIRNDRARICILAPGGHCARLSEKGVGWIGEQAMRLMRAHSLGSAIDALRSSPRVELLHVEPGRDEMQLFVHSMMSFSTGRELLEYGRDSGRRLFATSGAAILSTGGSCASGPDHSLTARHARAAV